MKEVHWEEGSKFAEFTIRSMNSIYRIGFARTDEEQDLGSLLFLLKTAALCVWVGRIFPNSLRDGGEYGILTQIVLPFAMAVL